MLIYTDPILNPEADPQAPPLRCYPLDKCPEWMYMCTTGIMKGDLWVPGDPEPPNGIYRMGIIKTEQWFFFHDPYDCEYAPQAGHTHCVIKDIALDRFFDGLVNQNCVKWFANLQVNPAIEKYYGGWALITEAIPEGGLGEEEIMSMINMLREAGTYARPTPMPGSRAVHAYYRKLDATNVKILYDYT